jgi:hypothetical protein
MFCPNNVEHDVARTVAASLSLPAVIARTDVRNGQRVSVERPLGPHDRSRLKRFPLRFVSGGAFALGTLLAPLLGGASELVLPRGPEEGSWPLGRSRISRFSLKRGSPQCDDPLVELTSARRAAGLMGV